MRDFRAHVKDMFENIVSRIRALVDHQIAAVEKKENKVPKVSTTTHIHHVLTFRRV